MAGPGGRTERTGQVGMRLRAVGDAAVLVELDPDLVLPFAEAVREQSHPAVTDIVPAERTVLVRFQPWPGESARVADWLGSVRLGDAAAVSEALIELDVHYDGEDLTEVARLTGLSVPEVIAVHTGQEWQVAFSGFAPGFGYLRGGSAGELLAVPRRDEPRVRVPAGAVALAAGYTGIYPRTSPGGWQLIGRVDAVLWDVERNPPALLRPGVRIRFRDRGSDV